MNAYQVTIGTNYEFVLMAEDIVVAFERISHMLDADDMRFAKHFLFRLPITVKSLGELA